MEDRIGRKLQAIRVNTVLPHLCGTVLDIGCGNNQLIETYGNGVGVDIHPWNNVDLLLEDCVPLPFEDEVFDTVTIIAALNHIPNRQDVLEEAFRVLCPMGRIIITMLRPSVSRVWHWLRAPWDSDQQERLPKEGEVYGFSPCKVRKLLTTAGFCIEKEQRFMLGLNRVTIGLKPKG